MAEPLDPNQLDQRAREQRAKEEREAAAQREREGVEDRETQLLATVEMRLKQSGASYTPEELAAELGAELKSVRRALQQAGKRSTATESDGRYRAAQRD